MRTTIISGYIGGDMLRVSVDLAEASAPIEYEGLDGEWRPTPYQTADAYHREYRAVRLVLEYLGREYWHDPLRGDEEAELNEIVDGFKCE